MDIGRFLFVIGYSDEFPGDGLMRGIMNIQHPASIANNE